MQTAVRQFVWCGNEGTRKKVTSFTYIPTYSRESASDNGMRRGYVHAVYEEICKEKMKTTTDGSMQISPAYFYLCGWKNMIDEAKQRIAALGYDRKSVHLELYG